MIGKITIREYGSGTPRGMLRVVNRALKTSWYEAGRFFHLQLRDRRFTQAHATRAGYTERKKRYEFRKFRKFGHTRPLEFTGETRTAVEMASISSTSKGGSVRYSGANKFNYRNPFSKPEMNLNLEFRRILPSEAVEIGRVVDEGMFRVFHEDMDSEVFELLGF